MIYKRFVSIFLLALFLTGVETVSAVEEQPIEVLRTSLDAGIAMLRDPRWSGAEQRIRQRDEIWSVLRGLFNFVEVSKRTLARNWLLFSPDQRREFTGVFSDILGYTYVGKIQGYYQGQEILYEKQEVDPSRPRAAVETKIVNNDREISIIYSFHRAGGKWLVYDVKVEGVSLVKNYRTQFNKILFKEKPEALIEKLIKKREALKSGSEEPGKGLLANP